MILFLGGIGKMISSAVNVVTKTVTQGAGGAGGLGGLLGGIVDTFSKIGGGGGGIFGVVGGLLGGPVGAIAGNILGSMVGGGTLPLPKGGALGGLLGGPGGIGGLISKGMEALGNFGKNVGEKLTKGSELLNKLLEALGAKPPQFPTLTGGVCFPGLPGGVHVHVTVGGQHGASPAPGGGTAAPPPPGQATGGTGGAGGTTPKSGDPLMQAAEKAYDRMATCEKELANLDPDSPDYQKKCMELQQKMTKCQQLLQMIQQAFKSRDEVADGWIRNMA